MEDARDRRDLATAADTRFRLAELLRSLRITPCRTEGARPDNAFKIFDLDLATEIRRPALDRFFTCPTRGNIIFPIFPERLTHRPVAGLTT